MSENQTVPLRRFNVIVTVPTQSVTYNLEAHYVRIDNHDKTLVLSFQKDGRDVAQFNMHSVIGWKEVG